MNKINNNNNNNNKNTIFSAEHITLKSEEKEGANGDPIRDVYKNQSSMSLTTRSSSCMDVVQGITKSSSSSMQTLRRILEIEEMRQFSEILELKLN